MQTCKSCVIICVIKPSKCMEMQYFKGIKNLSNTNSKKDK